MLLGLRPPSFLAREAWELGRYSRAGSDTNSLLGAPGDQRELSSLFPSEVLIAIESRDELPTCAEQSGRAAVHCGRRGREREPAEGWARARVCLSLRSRGSRPRLAASALHEEGETEEEGGGPRGGWARVCGGSQVRGLPECEGGTFWLGLKPPTSLAPRGRTEIHLVPAVVEEVSKQEWT